MKKIIILLIILMSVSTVYGSKFSAYLRKHEAREQSRQTLELQQDMNFKDFVFSFQRRFVNEQGQRCRDYIARSRTNPYRHAQYRVCDERF